MKSGPDKFCLSASVSPDGQRIAYIKQPDPGNRLQTFLCVCGINGEDDQVLTPVGNNWKDDTPSWSPAGMYWTGIGDCFVRHETRNGTMWWLGWKKLDTDQWYVLAHNNDVMTALGVVTGRDMLAVISQP